MRSHLRVRALREKHEFETGRKDGGGGNGGGPADVGADLMKAMGGLRKF